MYYSTLYRSPLGIVTLASDGKALAGLWLDGQKYHGGAITENMAENDGIPLFNTVKNWLDSYFAGEKPSAEHLPLAPYGGEFRRNVWNILLKIPYGQVVTYGDVAKKIAVKMNRENMSARAAGGAVGHNPVAIIIPCHRVVGANGSLTGYAGGIAQKVKLLELEGVDMSRLFVPGRT